MKNNNWIKNFIYFVVILMFFWGGVFLFRIYNSEIEHTYQPNMIYLTLINLISFCSIGVVLGLDNFIINYKKDGKWKINKGRLIILGLPAFLVAFSTAITSFMWTFFHINMRIDYFIPIDYMENTMIISNIILGHTIISSFYKD